MDMVRDAKAERQRRGGRVSGATRTGTVVATVRSRMQVAAGPARGAALTARSRRGTALVTAAALGPVSADAIAAYVSLGYG